VSVAVRQTRDAQLLDIVHDDASFLVVNKPAGLVCHPTKDGEMSSLIGRVRLHLGHAEGRLINRLDRETSGLTLVCKNPESARHFSQLMARRQVHKEYLALVWGQLERRAGTVHTGIGRSSANRQKMAVSKSADAREAITHYEVVEAYAAASLIRCKLETGRTHQIRVHMAHLGHPLLGDTAYGSGFAASKSKLSLKAQGDLTHLRGQALHAGVLGFDHPRTGKHLRFEAPLPEPMARLMASIKEG